MTCELILKKFTEHKQRKSFASSTSNISASDMPVNDSNIVNKEELKKKKKKKSQSVLNQIN